MRFVKSGEIVPWGISAYSGGHRVKLPLFALKAAMYDTRSDLLLRGWHVFGICLRTEQSGLMLRWGWQPVGGA